MRLEKGGAMSGEEQINMQKMLDQKKRPTLWPEK